MTRRPRHAWLGLLLLPLLVAWRWPGETNRLAAAGREAYRQGRFDEAAKTWSNALSGAGDSTELTYNLGTAWLQQREYARSLEVLGRAAERTDDRAALDRIHYNRGNAYFRLDKIPEAAQAYRQALAADPNDEDAAYNLRLCEERQKQQNNQSDKNKGGGQSPPNPQNSADKQNQPPRARPDDRQTTGGQQPSNMTEAEANRRLDGLQRNEREDRGLFNPRPSQRHVRPNPLDPNTSLDELLRGQQAESKERDW